MAGLVRPSTALFAAVYKDVDARHKAGHDENENVMRDGKERGGQTGERVAKVIARAGLASRREAEEWIVAGRVAVNGAVIATPARNVTSADRISVDGERLPQRERTRLFLYHKPRGLVTTHADPQGRPTIFQLLPKHLPRLISVGRLDFNTEGLILLTNDGGLARVLELPATGWLRRYRVRAHGSVTQAKLDELRKGTTVDGIHYGPIEAMIDRVQGSNLWLTLAIREGKNREVRNVLGDLGLTVARLIRVSFGPFQLGELPEGAVEEVRTRVLREQLGERLVAVSGADFSAPMAAPASPQKSDATHGRNGLKPARQKAAGEKPMTPKSPSRTSTSHTWRAREDELPAKKLRRKFRGSRRDDDTPAKEASGKSRAGLLTDRKGRRVLVQRFSQESPMPPRQGTRKPHRGPPRRQRRGR
jgi:23S rRNA pseudouridine2605 synthase